MNSSQAPDSPGVVTRVFDLTPDIEAAGAFLSRLSVHGSNDERWRSEETA